MAGTGTIAPLYARHVIVGVGDMGVSCNPQVTLSTYALGSCIGVVAYDPQIRAGGILHVILPDSSISPGKAKTQPAMFADTGLPLFFNTLVCLRADKERMRLLVAGGANVLSGVDPYRIGERNTKVTMDYLTAQGFIVRQAVTGGTTSRTLHLDLATGVVMAESNRYSLAA